MPLTQSAQILLVARRDPQDPIRRILRGAGYPVVSADSVSSGVRAAERARPALIIADPRALASGSGDNLASFATERHIPLILGWPDPKALLAEVERLLGRPDSMGREAVQLVAGPLQVDFATHVAKIGEQSLDLTAREFDLLCHLARHPGWVMSRQELLEHVWGYEYGDPRVVTVHIANLRKKLDAASPEFELIETVRNIGYKFVAPVGPDPGSPESEQERADKPTSPEPPADERRLVTVLFAHIGGLTRLAQSRDFESLHGLVNALFERVVPCIERYGGGVDRFIADSAMALFGAPVAQENDAEMAVRAALDIGSAVAGFEEENGMEGLSVHIGIASGMVIAGSIGAGTVQQYSVVGDAVDVASCLAERCGHGEILIGPETCRLAGEALDAEPSGKVSVRGRAEEVVYYRVKGIRQGRGSSTTVPGINSVLVGREDQMALFRGSLDRLEEGVGSVIFVIGEAGVGKSRLTAEVRREAASRGLKWLEGRTLSYGQTISYLPFTEILRADCGIQPDDPAPTREHKLAQRVERLFADRSAEFLPILASLLGLSLGRGAEPDPVWPEEESTRRRLFDRLGRYVSRLGAEEPVILVFEDVHWLDKSSADLIESLLPLTAQAPVVICLVGRGGAGSSTLDLLEAARRHQALRRLEIPLSPLSGRQTHELVCNLLGRSDIEPWVLRTIEQKSEGNPFFVEEMIRHLIDSGILRRDERGAWQVTRTSAEVVIPNTLQGVITARIDRLPPETKQELLRASVIGRSFFHRLLASLTSADPVELGRRLSYLQDHQLIFVKRHEPELEYAFKHALVQEAAYESILAGRRSGLHRQVARAIEDLFSGQIKDLYGILAYHYTKAADWENAQNYLLMAGDQSVSMAADAEAVAHYKEAMSALLRAFDESWDAPGSHDRVSWFVRRTEPFWLAGCLGDLLGSTQIFYEKVSTACGPADPRTLAATTILAACFYQKGLYDTAAGIIENALRSLEQSDSEDDPSLSRLLLLLGLCRLNTDRFSEAEEVLDRALVLEGQKAVADEGLLQDLYIYLSSAHFFTGRHDELRRVTEETLRKFDLQGTQRYWMLLINLCSANLVVGNWDEAAAQAQHCMDGITNPFLRAVAAQHLGEVRAAQGAYLEAGEHVGYAVATFETLGDSARRAEALADLAEIQLQAGKPDKAEETAQNAIRLMETTSNYSGVAAPYWTLAGIEMVRGRLDDAELLLQRSAEIAREKYSPRHPFCAELHLRRARLRESQGRVTEAEEDFKQAIELLADVGGEGHPRIRQTEAERHAAAAKPKD